MIMGAALLGRKIPGFAWAGGLGGLLPDIPMFIILAVLKLNHVPDLLIYSFLYFQNWWQIANAIAHSLILWPLAALLVWVASRNATGRQRSWFKLMFVVAASATLHSVIDFLVHREDAHMHFWPLTAWKFTSPVSYWNPMHYGRQFAFFEAVSGLAMALYLARTHASWIARGLLAIAACLYIAVPAYFILM
jgi:hypothetical protein